MADNDEFERMKAEFTRAHPEAATGAVYDGWLIGFLDLAPATRTAGVGIEHPDHGPIDASWTPGTRYLVRQVPELDGEWARCIVENVPLFIYIQDPRPPQPEAVLVTSPARFNDDTPQPAVPAWAAGLDGVGPRLLDATGKPVRWLLLDGYVYDIRDDLYGQPKRWSVNEWRPQTFGEKMGNPLDRM